MQSTSLGLVARVLLLRQWNSAEISALQKADLSKDTTPRQESPAGEAWKIYERAMMITVYSPRESLTRGWSLCSVCAGSTARS